MGEAVGSIADATGTFDRQVVERRMTLRGTKRKFNEIVDWSRDESRQRPRPEYFMRRKFW